MNRVFVALWLLCAQAALAACPEPPLSLCEMVQGSAWVVRAKVENAQIVRDSDDPEGIAGWRYTLKVITSYRGRKLHQITAYSPNTTARINLDAGGDYFVFVTRRGNQLPETANYCDDYSESPFNPALEKQIRQCAKRFKQRLKRK